MLVAFVKFIDMFFQTVHKLSAKPSELPESPTVRLVRDTHAGIVCAPALMVFLNNQIEVFGFVLFGLAAVIEFNRDFNHQNGKSSSEISIGASSGFVRPITAFAIATPSTGASDIL